MQVRICRGGKRWYGKMKSDIDAEQKNITANSRNDKQKQHCTSREPNTTGKLLNTVTQDRCLVNRAITEVELGVIVFMIGFYKQ